MLYDLWTSFSKRKEKRSAHSVEEIVKKSHQTIQQENCAHRELIRSGPSYLFHKSGYRIKNEGTICRDCSYTQEISHISAMRSDFEMDW